MLTKERKEYYIDLIKTSYSLNEVCQKANIHSTTGNYDTLKKIIKEENIDVTHFKRQHAYAKPKTLAELLVNGSTISSFKLKNKLLLYGFKEKKCECCGLTEWNGKTIPLELHHINGNNRDNRLENLQILCPNCHALTNNYGGRNINFNKKNEDNTFRKEDKVSIIRRYINEGKDKNEILNLLHISSKTLQRLCSNNSIVLPKKEKFSIEELIQLMKYHKSYTKVGKVLGISDNAVKKRFISRGYPKGIKELIKLIDNL